MPTVAANDIHVEYETFGDPDRPTALLVMGLGAQMLAWDEALCREIAARDFFVVRFDNRDSGLSTHLHDAPHPDLAAAVGGDYSSAAYTLHDMAADAVGLLDALGIGAAHVVGASMGGMIAQTIAIDAPRRVRSLCSIMSTSGESSVSQPTNDALAVLLSPPPLTAEEAGERSVRGIRVIGGKGIPPDEARVRALAMRSWNRNHDPLGATRQLLAILASGDRTAGLRALRVPTVVIHGTDDPLMPIVGGRATVDAIDGAHWIEIDGMGHDLPVAIWPTIVDAIAENAARASA